VFKGIEDYMMLTPAWRYGKSQASRTSQESRASGGLWASVLSQEQWEACASFDERVSKASSDFAYSY
jgi:hypothetical protein